MKAKTIFGFIFCFLFPIFFAGCDVIPSDERIVETDEVNPMKKVLLLDFTDQDCPNCPEALDAINQLQQDYGENIIPVTIHASSKYPPRPLVTADGNKYDIHYGTRLTGHPAAVVDGRFEGTVGIPAFFKCSEIVREQFNLRPSINIDLSAEHHAESNQLNINLILTAQTVMADAKCLVWIIEDNVIDWQIVGAKREEEYHHRHIFRASVNDTWGESVTLPVNESKNFNYTYPLNEKWKTKDISIVAFVYNEKNDVIYGVNEYILNSEQ